MNTEIKDITIDEIIDYCEDVLNKESKNSDLYKYNYHTRKLLLDLKDIQEDMQYKLGQSVWIMMGKEDKVKTLYYKEYLFIATCSDYVIVTPKPYEYDDNFKKQLSKMFYSSIVARTDIKIFHKRRVYQTKDEVKKVIKAIKGESNE